MKKNVKRVASVLIFAIVIVCSITGYYIYSLPNSFYVEENSELNFNCFFDIESGQSDKTIDVVFSRVVPIRQKVTLKLFGKIPIKEVNVSHVSANSVVPGGNPFGIKLITDGVMVIGISDVDCSDGNYSPARDVGIRPGDVILSINGNKITSNKKMADTVLNCQGEKLIVVVKRDSNIINFEVTPRYSVSNSCYRAGIWVRDSSAGIGTLTFYDPLTGRFGGLGHPVCDADTKEILPLYSGEVVPVKINGVTKGVSGKPGELLGSFVSSFAIGSLNINNETGVFGMLDSAPNNMKTIPIAFKQEIKTGSAKILTTLNGNTPEEFEIEIEKIDMNSDHLSKNMIIKITDPKLLEKTGGIVQGMSGSPIIQNGKLIGAVTHVLIKDPTRGYGIFIENMMDSVNNYSKVSD